MIDLDHFEQKKIDWATLIVLRLKEMKLTRSQLHSRAKYDNDYGPKRTDVKNVTVTNISDRYVILTIGPWENRQ